MKLVYLKTAEPDLRWFKHYYVSVFPEGHKKANAQFLATQKVLLQNPRIGEISENAPDVRVYHVVRTPFSFVYRLHGENIEVLRVVDNRSNWQQDDSEV